MKDEAGAQGAGFFLHPSDFRLSGRLYLIGPRGSGKTTLARLLAAALGWDWCDADRVLEARAGRSIRSLFETEGEAAFRDRESAILRELAFLERYVIATGGGVVLRQENRLLLRSTGRVVWLTADVQTLCQRLDADPQTAEQRPSLTGRTAVAPDEVTAILAARAALYAETAHLTLDTTGKPPEDLVAAILASVGTEEG